MTESPSRLGGYGAKAISKLVTQDWPRKRGGNLPMITCQLDSGVPTLIFKFPLITFGVS